MSIPQHALARIVARALEEDAGRGDLTSTACLEPGHQGAAGVCAREPLVLAGIEVAREVWRQVDPALRVAVLASDGARVGRADAVLEVRGAAAAILLGERVALNFLQRLSGIATKTRAFVDALPAGATTRIADTRKTTPGLRLLERHAVRCGGGFNHRYDLSSAVLIKDNHIAACGGVAEAIARARRYAPHSSRIGCEVESREALEEALGAGADIVLLDNFPDADLPAAVRAVAGRALVEVSGRVTLERVRAIASAGVDVISVGALTHSSEAADLGLDWMDA